MSDQHVVIPKGQELQYEEWGLAPALRVGDTIYCSGQLGLGPEGTLPADAEVQFDNAFRAVLEAAGSSLADIVEIRSHAGTA